ncbi:exonuclease SbcCD subunit D [Arthrobacter sp. NA-172]|uniref:metallophosphoesterase family protein n=1 Tax=Arthrobacter sp. NA-172 TaxID=3367524 RepID=UPI00375489A8
MRLLHTSDWHLGRSFHGVGMLDAQRNFIEQLLSVIREQSVDVVLIAGDVYDRALPGLDVVKLLDDALVRITDAGAKVVLTSGNHDSAIRLGFASRLLERGGVHLRTRVEDLDSPVLFGLDGNGAGSAKPDAPVLAVYGIPYLEPRLVAERLGVQTASHFDVTRAAVQLIREDIARRSESGPVHSVVLAHTFASGGITSDSERDLSIGGLGAVPWISSMDLATRLWVTFTGSQELSEHVRYSGSPLAYSFSEARHRKGAWLIDVGADGVGNVEEILWKAPRELAILRGKLAELLELEEYRWAESAYCR